MPKFFGYKLERGELVFLFILTITVLWAGWFMIGDLSNATQVRRRRLSKVRERFTKDFEEAWLADDSEVAIKVAKQQDRTVYLYFFRAIFVLGAVVTMRVLVWDRISP
ncbi:hypothetical protein WT71_31100 [Burkholderia stagnalis]|nr:hypothetical protein WT71_31100 [Burkholderia stagnalis]KWI65763.1 hypothetical protein WT73_19695 [Burkholderia stagnalis]